MQSWLHDYNKQYFGVVHSLKLGIAPEKWWLVGGRLLSFWGGLFLVAMLVSGRVVNEAVAPQIARRNQLSTAEPE